MVDKRHFLTAAGLCALSVTMAAAGPNASSGAINFRGAGAPVSVVTTSLASPSAGGAFEPAIAIDPANPMRIVVASMSGTSGTHHTDGGAWLWLTEDGGHTWKSRAMQPPAAAGERPTFSADVSPAFAADGTPLLTLITGHLIPGDGGNGGIFVTRLASDLSNANQGVEIMHSMDSGPGSPSIANDKPWMTVDAGRNSPFRGSVYVAASEFELPAHDNGTPTLVYPKLRLAISRNGGMTFLPTRTIAESAFWPFFSTSRDGMLDVVYSDLVWEAGDHSGRGRSKSSNAIRHLRSRDGGVTFEPAALVAKASDDVGMSMPSVAARENGDLLACWAQAKETERATRVRCAIRQRGQDWGQPDQPGINVGASVVTAYPTVVAVDDAWYLMLYLVGAHQTEVAVFRSNGVSAFTKISTLATAPGLGLDRLCLLTASCPKSTTNAFDIGDYVSMSSANGRLAAVYVLPKAESTTPATPNVVVSVLDLAK